MADPLCVLDLFSGAGGLSEGFRQAGYRIAAATDVDPDACATFSLNFPEARVVCGDIRDPKVRKVLPGTSHEIDVVVGGPPCQAFSQVRNHCRLIEDPRNSLYREFVGILESLEPRAFLMENVPGLDQMGVHEQVIEDLTLNGLYSVRSQVVDAADFGVPQTRKRILFLGIHSSYGLQPPILSGSGATAAFALERRSEGHRIRYRVVSTGGLFATPSQLRDPDDAEFVTAYQAIGDLVFLKAASHEDVIAASELLPPVSEYQRRMRDGLGNTLTNVSVPRINRDTVLRLSKLPPGANFRDLPAKFTRRYLTGELWGPSNGTGSLGRRHYYAYRRLHPGIWSWTLNTKGDSVYHFRHSRALSVREFARLQSFPDRFVFTTDPRKGSLPGRIDGGAVHSRYRQAGNAVPPLLARTVASQLARVIAPARLISKSA